MANRIAEAFVELKVKGAEKVKSVIKGVNKEVEQTDKQADKLGKSFQSGFGAAEKFQSLLGKLLIPVGIVTSIGSIVASFRQGIKEARAFREEIESLSKTAEEITRQFEGQARAISPAVKQAAELRKEYQDLIEDAEKRLAALGDDSFFDESIAAIRGLFTDEPVTVARKQTILQKEISDLYDQQLVAVARISRINASIAQQAAEKATRDNEALEILKLQQQAAQAKTADERRALDIEAARLDITRQLREVNEQIRDQESFDVANDPFVKALQARKRLLEELFRIQVGNINAAADAQIKADRKAEEERRQAARETARIIAESNAQAAAETRQALLDAVSSINSDRGAFSDIQALIASVVDDVKQIRGRI